MRLQKSVNRDFRIQILFMFADDDNNGRKHEENDNVVDKELEAAFNTWKSKTYALTVPLKIVALRGSIPPSWIKALLNFYCYLMLCCLLKSSLKFFS